MLNTNARINSEDAESLVWLAFLMEVSCIKNYGEILALLRKQPPLNTPGREYFENFGLFIGCYAITPKATAAELEQYLRITRLIGPTFNLPPSALAMIEEDLQKAINDRGPLHLK